MIPIPEVPEKEKSAKLPAAVPIASPLAASPVPEVSVVPAATPLVLPVTPLICSAPFLAPWFT